MNNSVSSSVLEKGYTHGIYAEYCPEGVFNLIGNDISGAGNGMTLIGCSPFVAQNTLTGNEYSDCGLFLDNSNGTFEYNVISDFYYSYFSYYSSPDLLKNIFDNYYDDNIWLSSSSVPVMHPLINAGSVYWYAGDNTIKGSPSEAGIIFEEDAYPMLNYGYNKFMMTNNDYYISGTNPSGGNREYYVLQNYWGGTPDTNKFNVANADVIYIPYDNNSSSARETNSDDKFDIGFGLYDTVFYYEPDNPNSAQDIYLEAYQKEYAGEYSQAIDIYKEIVEEYKDSSYTSSCMSRIFSCFEKKNSAQSDYSSLENYYSNISSDTSYTEIQRNIAEEFMIKSKVKQNNIEEAISDYNGIYNQNINTPKGTHALINKEILSAGAGDNMLNNSAFEKIELKLNALNHLFSNIIKKEKNIFPDMKIKQQGYSLSQNFPNPFNPITKISFKCQVSSYVSLKVFDALGKEVATLVNQKQNAGRYEVEFDGSNFSSGIYFYTLKAGEFTDTKRMLLIK